MCEVYVAVGLDFGPFAVDVDNVDDASVGMVLTKKANDLARRGGREMVAEKHCVVVRWPLRCLNGFFLGGQGEDMVCGRFQDGLAELRKLLVEAQREDFHGDRVLMRGAERRIGRITETGASPGLGRVGWEVVRGV